MDSALRRQLARVNWDFPASGPEDGVPLHWYPGTFTPALASTLIAALSEPGDLVLDPFGGVGTSGAEAIRLGRCTWLVEQSPIGALASYVWLGSVYLSRDDPQSWRELGSRLEHHIDALSPPSNRTLFEPPLPKVPVGLLAGRLRPEPKDFFGGLGLLDREMSESLKRWLHPKTIAKLQVARVRLKNEEEPFVRLCLLAMLSHVLRGVSSQTRSWGHIADNVGPRSLTEKDLGARMRRWLARFRGVSRRTQRGKRFPRGLIGFVSLHDWIDANEPRIRPRRAPTLLLTSPPYGGAIDYTLAQRLSLYFLGYEDQDIGTLISTEIGARRKRFGRESRAMWAADLVAAFQRMLPYSPSKIALVMPAKNQSRAVGAEVLKQLLGESGWSLEFEVERSIRKAKARQSWTSISREDLLIFEKGE